MQLTLLLVGVVSIAFGSILGYYARQSIAKKQAGTIEAKIQKKVSRAKSQSEELLTEAKQKATQIVEQSKKEEDERRTEILKTERLLLKKENFLDEKLRIMYECIFNYYNEFENKDYNANELSITFTANIPKNKLEEAQYLQTLNAIPSKFTAQSSSAIIDNPAVERQRMLEEEEIYGVAIEEENNVQQQDEDDTDDNV